METAGQSSAGWLGGRREGDERATRGRREGDERATRGHSRILREAVTAESEGAGVEIAQAAEEGSRLSISRGDPINDGALAGTFTRNTCRTSLVIVSALADTSASFLIRQLKLDRTKANAKKFRAIIFHYGRLGFRVGH